MTEEETSGTRAAAILIMMKLAHFFKDRTSVVSFPIDYHNSRTV
jgi:hypothetical protein